MVGRGAGLVARNSFLKMYSSTFKRVLLKCLDQLARVILVVAHHVLSGTSLGDLVDLPPGLEVAPPRREIHLERVRLELPNLEPKKAEKVEKRYSDGRLVIDFVAEYLNLPYIPPYANKSADTTHGVNFAVGGCTVIPYSFFQKIGQKGNTVPESLFPTQLEWFKDHIKGSGCKDAASTPKQCKAVFDGALVWIGEIAANDYNYITGTNTTSKTLQELAI
nr:GDSL esterase/lipase At3g48460-like [Tanacetum cinerariifolium]